MSEERRDGTIRDRLTSIVDELAQRRAPVAGPMAAPIVDGMVLASEREGGPWISCAPCSGAMAAHYADPGIPATLAAGHKIRTAAGLPHSGGMSAAQLRAGVSGAYGLSLEWVDKGAIRDRLGAGYAVAAFLTYGSLPSHFRRWCPDFTGGHAVALAGLSSSQASVGIFDPLATAGYPGEWIRWEDLAPALWSDHLGKVGGSDMATVTIRELVGPSEVSIPPGSNLAGYSLQANGTVAVSIPSIPWPDGSHMQISAEYTGSAFPTKDGAPITYGLAVCPSAYCVGSSPALVPLRGLTVAPYVPSTDEGGDYDEGYGAGRRDEWDAWDAALGIPDRPA